MTKGTQLRHEMILASAGSGKTYRLTDRYLQLLRLGAAPESIVALTFTRKAAGEFFDAILRKLVEAAADDAKRANLAEGTGGAGFGSELTAPWCLAKVRELVTELHRLRLGTLDSFLTAILRSFPLEFGMSGQFEILSDPDFRREKQNVYRRVFDSVRQDKREVSAFLEAFKQATFGVEERSLLPSLDNFVGRYHRVYLAGPEEDRWGNAARIWPEGNPLLLHPPAAEASGEALCALLEQRDDLGKNGPSKWEEVIAAVVGLQPGGKLPKTVDTPVNNIFGALANIESGEAKFAVGGKSVTYGPDECRHIAVLAHWVIFCELAAKLQATRGIWRVLDRYENEYGRAVRRSGKLRFDDVQNLLGGVLPEVDNFQRWNVDFRLDGHFEHWLLDEFQDTNFAQWRAVRNLVDEVIQDDSGRRSFFYVGDVKQAIYGWRGGDSRLFHEIREHYNGDAEGPIYQPPALHRSWRSGEAVIAAVNRAFGDRERMAGLLPEETVARWMKNWESHEVVLEDCDGVVEFYHPVEDADDDAVARYEILLALLQEIQPHRRGLSCAVIVRKNNDGKAIAEFLRANGDIPVTVSADISLGADNPVIAGLLALLRSAAHPGDEFAWQHLLMGPLGAWWTKRGLTRDEVVREVLGDVHARGFEATFERWLERLGEGGIELDAYNRTRAEELLQAARLVDATGNREIRDFVDFLDSYQPTEPEADGVVQILTMHKSKGLEYDVVFLPALDERRGLAEFKGSLAVQLDEERDAEWVLELPNARVRDADAVLSSYVEQRKAESALENLCGLYVGMTRARHATYLVTKGPGKGSQSTVTAPRYLRAMLGADSEEAEEVEVGDRPAQLVYREGNPEWYAAMPLAAGAGGDEESVPSPAGWASPDGGRRFPRRARRLPSASHDEDEVPGAGRRAGGLFSRSRNAALNDGSAVHALFEEISWLGAAETAEELRSRWLAREAGAATDRASFERAVEEVFSCLTTPGVSEYFQSDAAAGQIELWREKPFEMIVDGDWVSGVFDRVTLWRDDPGGKVVRAQVMDFKTDRIDRPMEEIAGRYRGQIELYGTVLARLTGLGVDEIEAVLILTREPCAVPLGGRAGATLGGKGVLSTKKGT